MDRRNFIGVIAAGAALSGVVNANTAIAKTNSKLRSAVEGSLYLTKEKPGRWAAKVAGHLPLIDVQMNGGKTVVNITTPHEMNGYEHYIVKHQLFDKDMNLLSEKMFDPTKEGPVSNHDTGDYAGTVYAVSVCNKHDAWVVEATV